MENLTEHTFDTNWQEAFTKKEFKVKLKREILPPYLLGCRWFAAKSGPIKQYEIETALRYSYNQKVYFLIFVEVVFYTANTENYFLPLALTEEDVDQKSKIAKLNFTSGETGYLVDALFLSEFRESLFLNIAQRNAVNVGSGSLFFERGPNLQAIGKKEIVSSMLSAEQSNTTLVYNDLYYLKIYRKLFRDTNPDYEITKFLTKKSNFKNVPEYSGAITWGLEDSFKVSIGLMQKKIENEGDAWNFFLKKTHEYFKRVSRKQVKIELLPKIELYKPTTIQNLPLIYIELITLEVLSKVELLAKRTAEMHHALFSEKVDKNFAPIAFSEDYRVWLLNKLMYQLDNRVNLLENNLDRLSPKSKAFAEQFLENKGKVKAAILNFNEELLNSSRIRIHGDYHLGQVIMQDDDFYILDFEGEPESTIRDRKVKQPPLKDVAGMCRSFHYAVYATVFKHAEYGMGEEEMAEAGGRFYRAIVGIFLNTYIKTAMELGLNIGYNKEINFLLRYHLFEKAIYELGYELNSRPDWVVIPLKGISQIINND
ncbi:MAG: maltokinase N-terminal cap-like domain-containing protein [Luteibaculaceae bacterium]